MVCRVFKKKSQKPEVSQQHELGTGYDNTKLGMGSSSSSGEGIGELRNKHVQMQEAYNDYGFDGCMQLPQLFSPESSVACPPISLNAAVDSPQNTLWRLSCGVVQHDQRLNTTDWSFLNKLLASDQHYSYRAKSTLNSDQLLPNPGHPNFKRNPFPYPYPYPYPYIGSDADYIKFSK